METELKTAIQLCADEFARGAELKLSTIAMRATRDARFFERLSSGCGFTVKTYDRVMAYFSENWPAAARWPESVPRPKPPPLV